MNVKNLIMWAIIVLLSVGLFNMFQNPNKISYEYDECLHLHSVEFYFSEPLKMS